MGDHVSFFKTPIAGKVARVRSAEKLAREELRQKAIVRGRDRYCRFPLCGCRHIRLALHVSHKRHKGMGGNPKGDRSTAAGLVLLCSARHKENGIAVDRGTLRWRPLTKKGANGPIAWDVDLRRLRSSLAPGPARWLEVARETAVGLFEPWTPEQRAVLEELRTMER